MSANAAITGAAVEALEDAKDIRAVRAALAEPGPNIPLPDVLSDYADDLADEPNAAQR